MLMRHYEIFQITVPYSDSQVGQLFMCS